MSVVAEEMVEAALDAYSENEWRTSASAMRAALAAVAPLIAAQERERCAKVCAELLNPDYSAENEDWCAGTEACATAIRALGDAT